MPSFSWRRTPRVIDAETVTKAVNVALRPDELAQYDGKERQTLDELAKAINGAASWTRTPSTNGRTDRTPKPVSAADVAARAVAQLAPSASITPVDIEAALRRQGVDWVEPFAPGKPLVPYYGYNRRPRNYDYRVGRNITTETRPDRIPFETLQQVIEGYDIASICVVPGTPIVTKRGLVPIEDVAVGDQVLTHKGRFRRVYRTMVNPAGDRAVVRVDSEGFDPVTLTADHPMYVLRGTELVWIAAGSLLPTDCVTQPTPGIDKYDGWPLNASTVSSVTPVEYEGVVHNIEVEEDHSYVTTGGTVHNCIRHSINDLRSMKLMFRPLDGHGKCEKEIEEARKFLRRPDGKRPFVTWLAQWMMDVLRYDAGALYKERNRAGKVTALKIVQGTSVAPILDYFGDRPEPPAPAFQQFIQGIPWDWLTTDDLIYEPQWPIPESPYGVAPIETVLLNANCFSADTEVLTQRGWLRFPDVDIATDFIATRNPKTKAFEWQQATKYYEAAHNGPMYHFTGRSVDVLVTEGHRMLVDRRPKGCPTAEEWGDGEWRIQAGDLAAVPPTNGVRIPITSNWDAPDLATFRLSPKYPNRKGFTEISGDDYAAFMGMWLAEGSCAYEPGRRNDIWISQQRESRGFEAYKRLLDRLVGGTCHYNGKVFRFHNSALASYLKSFGKATEKFIPDEILSMSRRQLAIFWEHYYLGDGSAGRVCQITTASQRMADGLQEVAQKLGWSATVRRKTSPKPGRIYNGKLIRENAPCLAVVVTRANHHRFDVETEPYTGNVYCVSVPNRVIYVRRNGMPVWCGQTDVRLQYFFLTFFTAGAVPEMFMNAPPDMSDPDSLAELQETWDDWYSQNQSGRHGARWIPAESKPYAYKQIEQIDPKIAEYVMRRTIAAFGRVPQDLGVLAEVNRSSSDTQMDQQFRISTLPDEEYYEALLNAVLQDDLQLPVEVRFDDGREKEDRLMEAQTHQIWVSIGAEGPDEIRDRVLGLPVDYENPVPRFFDSQKLGPTPLSYLYGNSGEIHPTTLSPVGPVPQQPFVPVYGLRENITPEGNGQPEPIEPKGPSTKPAAALRGQAGMTPPVAKSAGITVGTGIAGVPSGVDPGDEDDELDEDACRDLARWRTQSRNRIAKGRSPRPFTDSAIPDQVAARVWSRLASAATREQVDEAFTVQARKSATPPMAGLALRAKDTGRVLMCQRGMVDGDPAAGTWEFPGGHVDSGESSDAAARREWEEETGYRLPDDAHKTGEWESANGIYRGHVYEVASEDSLSAWDRDQVRDPDNPGRDYFEAVAWFDPAHLSNHPALRPELAADSHVVQTALLGFAKAGGGRPKVAGPVPVGTGKPS